MRPADKSALGNLLDLIAETNPLGSMYLRDKHDEWVQTSLQDYQQMRQFLDEAHRPQRARDEAQNEKRDRHIEDVSEKSEEVVAKDRAALRELDNGIVAERLNAAHAFGKIGAPFKTSDTLASLDLPTVRPINELAGREEKAFHTSDDELSKNSRWDLLLPIAYSVSIGISLGIALHVLEPDKLSDQLGVAGICAVAGLIPAVYGKKGLASEFLDAAREAHASDKPRRLSYARPLTIALFVALTSMALERNGLLAVRELKGALDSLGGGAARTSFSDELTSWLIPSIFTFPFILSAASKGNRIGKHQARENRLLSIQHLDFENQVKARRDDKEACEAIEATNILRCTETQQADLKNRIDDTHKACDIDVKRIHHLRPPRPWEYHTSAADMLERCRQQVTGQNIMFDKALGCICNTIEKCVIWGEDVGSNDRLGSWRKHLSKKRLGKGGEKDARDN